MRVTISLLFLLVAGVTLVLAQELDDEGLRDGLKIRSLFRNRPHRRPVRPRRLRPQRVEEEDLVEEEPIQEEEVQLEERRPEIPRRRVVVRKFRPRLRPKPAPVEDDEPESINALPPRRPVLSQALPPRAPIPSQALPARLAIPAQAIPAPIDLEDPDEEELQQEEKEIFQPIIEEIPDLPQRIEKPVILSFPDLELPEPPAPRRITARIRPDQHTPRPRPIPARPSVFTTERRPSVFEDDSPAPAPQRARPSSGVRPKTKHEPVPIVENYSHENEDGSFTFGYMSADGSFKEETRGIDCIVRGKFGYIDPDGVKREFTYTSGLPCDEEDEEFDQFGNPLNPEVEEDLEFNIPSIRRPITPDRPRPRPIQRPVLQQTIFQEEEEEEEEEFEVPVARRPVITRPKISPIRITQPAVTVTQPRPVRPAPVRIQQPRPVRPAPVRLPQQVPAAPARLPQRVPAAPVRLPQQIPAVVPKPAAPKPADPVPAAPKPAPVQTPKRVVTPVQATPSNFNFQTEVNRFSLPRGQQQREGAVYSTQLIFDPVTGQYNTVVVQQIPQTGTNVAFQSQLQAVGARPAPTEETTSSVLREPKPAPRPATAAPAVQPPKKPQPQATPQRVQTTQVFPARAPTTQSFPPRAPTTQVFPARTPTRQVFPARAPTTQVFPARAPTTQVFPQRPQVLQSFQRPAATSPVFVQPGQPTTASEHINKFISDFNLGISF